MTTNESLFWLIDEIERIVRLAYAAQTNAPAWEHITSAVTWPDYPAMQPFVDSLVSGEPDPRIIAALDAKRAWLNGTIDNAGLQAAEDAALSVSRMASVIKQAAWGSRSVYMTALEAATAAVRHAAQPLHEWGNESLLLADAVAALWRIDNPPTDADKRDETFKRMARLDTYLNQYRAGVRRHKAATR